MKPGHTRDELVPRTDTVAKFYVVAIFVELLIIIHIVDMAKSLTSSVNMSINTNQV